MLLKEFRYVLPKANEGWQFTDGGRDLLLYRISTKKEEQLYDVSLNGCVVANDASCSMAAHHIMQGISDNFCTWTQDDICIAHACAAHFAEKAVLLMGSSGSGKTSLAVAFSRYAPFIGDECVFIDVNRGTAWCEDFPFQIKSENEGILAMLDRTISLTTDGGPHGKTHYFSRYSINADLEPTKPKKICCIVFPIYDSHASETLIGNLPASRLVNGILGSLIGKCTPSEAFKVFTKMLSSNGIKVIELRYSDVSSAAKKLFDYIDGGEGNEL
jgi:hypothetical protein